MAFFSSRKIESPQKDRTISVRLIALSRKTSGNKKTVSVRLTVFEIRNLSLNTWFIARKNVSCAFHPELEKIFCRKEVGIRKMPLL